MADGANLIIVNDSAFAKGGATKLAIESAIGASQAGWNVRYLAPAAEDWDPRLYDSGINMIPVEGERLSQGKWYLALRSALWNRHALAVLKRELEMSRPDRTVIHVHNWSHFMSPSIFKALAPVSERVMLTAHDFFLSCGNGAQYNYNHRQVCNLIGNSRQCVFSRCDKTNEIHKIWRMTRHQVRVKMLEASKFKGALAVIHPGQIPFLKNAGFSDDVIKVIRNPITALVGERVPAECNRQWLFIGRLSEEKGARIAAELAKRAKARIVFCGEGPLRAKLTRAYPNAEFKGFCSRDQLAEELRRSRFVLMPSRFEPFGLVAIEAIWSGVPIIISDTALIAKDIKACGAGLSLDMSDIGSVSQSIQSLMDDDLAIKTMSEKGFSGSPKIANTPPDWINTQLSVYNALLNAKS